jgi:hypothetical protein
MKVYRRILGPVYDSEKENWRILTNKEIYARVKNTLSLRSSFNVSDQVSHPYRTTGKIIVLYILIFKFLDSNPEDKRFCTE